MGNRASSSMLQDDEIKLISEETGFPPARIEILYTRFKSLDKSGIGSLSRQDFLRVPEFAINPLCDRIVHMFFVDCDEDHDRINFRQFMKLLATFRSSSRPVRSRNASRQESIKNIWNSQNTFRHSRHSSCDGFFNYNQVQTPHMTNQHSIHYVASTTHLANSQFSYPHSNNNYNSNNNNNNNYNIVGNPLDPDEPANSRKQKLFFMFKIYDTDNDNLINLNDLKTILTMMVGKYVSESKITDLANRTLNLADKDCNGSIDFDEFCTAFLHRDIDDLLRVRFS